MLINDNILFKGKFVSEILQKEDICQLPYFFLEILLGSQHYTIDKYNSLYIYIYIYLMHNVCAYFKLLELLQTFILGKNKRSLNNRVVCQKRFTAPPAYFHQVSSFEEHHRWHWLGMSELVAERVPEI